MTDSRDTIRTTVKAGEYVLSSGTARSYAEKMRDYIERTYGSAAAAEAHENAYRWYAGGGTLPPGDDGA
jgi:hypothetical protein